MILKFENFTKKIGKKTILDNINLTLEGGKIYGLRGINGCGKTMLIRAACGLIYPNNGSVSINNEVLGKDISFPRSVGVLIESPAFLPEYSAKDNLLLISSINNTATETEIEKTLKQVGLDAKSKKTFSKFSLGMKQKLGIAAAIFESPELVLLDEPFNALDEKSVTDVKNIIKALKNKDRIIVLACHDRTILNDISDSIIEMEEGKII